jgi:hypothetical protein
MRRALAAGLLLAAVLLLLAVASDLLSISVLWPVALGAALLLAPGHRIAGRLGMFVGGTAAAWLGYALLAGFLPDVRLARGLAVAVPVLLITALAVLPAARTELWAGIVGVAAFGGIYDAAFRASPTAFLSDSVTAWTTLLLTVSLGAAVGLAARLAAAPPTVEPATAPVTEVA